MFGSGLNQRNVDHRRICGLHKKRWAHELLSGCQWLVVGQVHDAKAVGGGYLHVTDAEPDCVVRKRI